MASISGNSTVAEDKTGKSFGMVAGPCTGGAVFTSGDSVGTVEIVAGSEEPVSLPLS